MPDNSTKVAEPVTSREVAEKISEAIMTADVGTKLIEVIRLHVQSAITTARADLARKMIEAAKQPINKFGCSNASGAVAQQVIIEFLETVARDAGIEID